MITSISLRHFKAFRRMRVPLRSQSVLVGPNNAGKSTVIAALRATANMIRLGRRLTANRRAEDGGAAWSFSGAQVALVEENLRHEFREERTELAVAFEDGARLEAVWPVSGSGDEAEPYFVIYDRNAVRLRRAAEVRRSLPVVAAVPPLRPIDRDETVLSTDHVRANLDTTLSSAHFRNQLFLLQQTNGDDENAFDVFRNWASRGRQNSRSVT